jgi:hypothetical protein
VSTGPEFKPQYYQEKKRHYLAAFGKIKILWQWKIGNIKWDI